MTKSIHNDVYVESLRKSQPHPEARPVFFDVPGRRARKHVGWLMPEVKNHVKEQPTNRWKQVLIDRQRAAARGEDT